MSNNVYLHFSCIRTQELLFKLVLDVAVENRGISEKQTKILERQRKIEVALGIRGGNIKMKNTIKFDNGGEPEPELPEFPLKYDEKFTSFNQLEKDINDNSAFRSYLVKTIKILK